MEWKVGFKLTHPFNPDWGVGEVLSVAPFGRSITVRFPGANEGADETVTLSTHAAAFQRWAFPVGARARITQGPQAGHEVVLLERTRGAEGFDVYRTTEGLELEEQILQPLRLTAGCLSRLANLDVDSIEHFENRYAGMQLELERQANGLAGILGARVTLFPHQLYVATRATRRQPVRALLADEVGLGKTIEAGMIYSALRQAGRAARVLILTPDALAVQWLGEMFRKFHDVFVLMDDDRLEDAAADHPELSPWEVYPRTVCSLPFLAANELLAMDAADIKDGWDLLIVDEAHHLRYEEGGGNAAYQAVESIAANARNILFLTATPMELDRTEYFGLLRLLQPNLFHDFELFEIQLEEISQANELAAMLEAALKSVEKDEAEVVGPSTKKKKRAPRLPEDLADRVADAFPDHMHFEELAERAQLGDVQAIRQLLGEMIHIHPLGDTVFSNTRSRVGGFPERRGEVKRFPLSPARRQIYTEVHNWVAQLAPKGIEPRSPEARRLFDLLRLSAGPLAGLKHELNRYRKVLKDKGKAANSTLETLVELCERTFNEDNPRLDALVQEVRDAVARKEKLLVFVSHIQDLEHLKEKIEARAGVRVASFHELMPAADRDIQVAMFRNPEGYPVLLSSEAGGEGRNFQFCHRLIHYDLPASPNRVEQRIGRLDRIGQTREVESVVLVSEDTIEAHVAELLDTHIGVFRHTIGGLDPVLEEIGDLVVKLSLSKDSQNPDAWQAMIVEANGLLHGARDMITRGLDHLLHRGAFDQESGVALRDSVAEDLEERLEEFVIEFCEQTGITVQDKDHHGTYFLALDRYTTLDGLPGVSIGTGYVGTFQRERALDREDHDFYATGHPLIEGIFSYLRDTPYGTVALRRYKKTGQRAIGLQFNYRFEPDATGDVDATVFFPPRIQTFAMDLKGRPLPKALPLLTARHSKAYAMDLEDVQDITLEPGWMSLAVEAAEVASQDAWDKTVEEAVARFDAFRAEEEKRLEAFFEHRLDTAEAQLAFAKNPVAIKVAKLEVKSIREEWAARLASLASRRESLLRGTPILDAVCLFVMDP